MAPAYKLSYFAFKGLGEPARMLMKYGGIKFEDERFTYEEWANVKPKMPFEQIPVLTIDGQVINQSLAICRLLGKRVGLVGKNDLEDAEIDSIVDSVNDMRLKIATIWYEKDPDKKEVVKKTVIDGLPFFLERFVKAVEQNEGHLALKKLTWADFYFVGIIDVLSYLLCYDFIDPYPNLCALRDTVLALPAIKKWLKERPETEL